MMAQDTSRNTSPRLRTRCASYRDAIAAVINAANHAEAGLAKLEYAHYSNFKTPSQGSQHTRASTA